MSTVPRPERVFLLSPANLHGKRAHVLTRHEATFDLALRLRQTNASLGEVFSFVSGLYFRGKLAYANAFSTPPPGVEGTWVITAGRGLLPAHRLVSLSDLEAFRSVVVGAGERNYRDALMRDALRLRQALAPNASIVLLGSIATTKYSEPLLEVFGSQLLFPMDFIGRGDLSRGGLLLRAVAAGQELPYEAVGPATRHGQRPPKLVPR